MSSNPPLIEQGRGEGCYVWDKVKRKKENKINLFLLFDRNRRFARSLFPATKKKVIACTTFSSTVSDSFLNVAGKSFRKCSSQKLVCPTLIISIH